MSAEITRIAAPVAATRSPGSARVQRTCACASEAESEFACPACRASARVQRSAAGAAPAAVPPIVHEVLGDSGRTLTPLRRAAMEAHFGYDFGRVRVHSGPRAAASTRAVNALAYAVGPHVVFADERQEDDDHLLAHELAHVIQQGATALAPGSPLSIEDEHAAEETAARGAAVALARGPDPKLRAGGAPRLQRQPAGTGRAPAPATLNTVEVDQATPQTVTLNWSDGSSESAQCSTGKGHCCLDESAAEGAACSEAGSRADGSNCTPVGTFRVTAKIPVTGGGVRLWTQFHDARSIALHEYSPVDGTPLSHGCVRLNRDTAQKIFDGAVRGRTRVIVRNLAKPRCDHPTLRNEWRGDFEEAGSQPPDGDVVDPFLDRRPTRAEIRRAARGIATTRRMLRSALGTDEAGLTRIIEDLRTRTGDFATFPSAEATRTRAEIAQRIPRCVPTRTTEEERTSSAAAAGLAGLQPARVRSFERALDRAGSRRSALAAIRRAGRALWEWAVQEAEAGGERSDDRLLYWTRLELAQVLREYEPPWMRPPAMNPDQARRTRGVLLEAFERASRGMDTATFGDAPEVRRIVVTGFDPFALGGEIRRGNPAGAAALDLDNELFTTAGGVEGRVQTAIFPVRYVDFEGGAAESFFGQFLSGRRPADLIVTISMGSSTDFELEEFAGRRRSVASGASENLGMAGGGTERAPREIPGAGAGPEFLRTNVPAADLEAMRGTLGRRRPLPGERAVREIQAGETSPRRSASGPTAGSTAVAGSGGGFLSNEIYYRTRLLQHATQELGGGSAITRVIHVHTPLLDAPDATDRRAFDARRNALVRQVRALILAALGTL